MPHGLVRSQSSARLQALRRTKIRELSTPTMADSGLLHVALSQVYWMAKQLLKAITYPGRWMPRLVEDAVKGVLDRLGRPALHVADMPVDLRNRVADIQQRLAHQADGRAAVLGLHGMGGIGKTTLAKAVYKALHIEFPNRCCFVEVGREVKDAALQKLQRQMLRELCGVVREFEDVAAGTAELERRLRGSAVLLVIDDIWLPTQRDALLVPVGPGSRVLLTTRNAQLLQFPNIQRQRMEVLNSSAALELFCQHAFLASKPLPGYSQLAAEAVDMCAGLPLTLRVIGAYLWDQLDQEAWQAALAKLKAAQPLSGCKTEDDELWGKLRLSYDALYRAEQEMFLDIACCMLGKEISTVLPAWGPGAKTTLCNLISRSLVSESDWYLKVHDQLRDMAREIVVMENRLAPALRSRIWMPEAFQLASNMQVGRLHLLCFADSLGHWSR